VTDNIPAITLGFTPTSSDIMKEKPRKNARILTREFVRIIVINGLIMASIIAAVLYLSYNVFKMDSTLAQTTVLASIILMQIANAYNFRSFRFGVLNKGIFVNKFLVYASIISLFLLILVIYSPLNRIFEITQIGISSWIMALFSAFLILIIFDLLKIINNKDHRLLTHTT
jgi:Ca2+-transporting ATPase